MTLNKGTNYARATEQVGERDPQQETVLVPGTGFDRLMREDSSSHAWSEKEELANLVVSKVHADLGIEDQDSSRSYDDGGVDHDDGGHVSKSRKVTKVETRRLHKQIRRANVSTKLESYEDLEARMEHMGSPVKGHFDEDSGCAMTRSEWEAIAHDSAKKAADAR